MYFSRGLVVFKTAPFHEFVQEFRNALLFYHIILDCYPSNTICLCYARKQPHMLLDLTFNLVKNLFVKS